MKVFIIRSLDYLVGIPLCLIFSVAERLKQIISWKRTKEGGNPKKILIIKPFELGSIILSLPMIEKIQQMYPDAKIYFLTSTRNKNLFRLFDSIPSQRIISFNEESIFSLIQTLWKATFQIRKLDIDTTIDLEFFSRFSAIISYLSKAKKRIGFDRFAFEGLYRGSLITHKMPYNPHLHISQVFYSFVELLALPDKSTPTLEQSFKNKTLSLPEFSPSEKFREKVGKKLQKYEITEKHRIILVNPGEGLLPLREWPIENFMEVIRKIIENPDQKVLLVGTLKCKDKAAEILKTLDHPNIVDLTSQTSIEELLTLISSSHCLLSNDSGMAHLGALTGTPQIVLFGPEHPRVFGPLGKNVNVLHSKTACSPCLSIFNHRKSNCRDNICLKNIQPQEVLNVLENI